MKPNRNDRKKLLKMLNSQYLQFYYPIKSDQTSFCLYYFLSKNLFIFSL